MKKNTRISSKGAYQEGYVHRGRNKRALHQSGSMGRIRLPPGETIKYVVLGLLLTVGVSFLFYRSPWAFVSGVILVPICVHRGDKCWQAERIKRIQRQFVSFIQLVAGALAAGYSMENSWRQAEPELLDLYGEQAEVCVELKKMNQRLAMNEPLEQILLDFADVVQVEDISNFTEIFRYAKRSGGNLTEIIRKTVERMQEKAEILAEIETAIAAKRMEQRMMVVLVPGVLVFVTLSSPTYVSSLYHNGLGILVMSICLLGYIICCFWSEKLIDIAV